MDIESGEFCTTSQAAVILGVSTTAVQALMNIGAISGWKTRGGHRRISRQSVHAYLRQNQFDAMPLSGTRSPRRIMVVMRFNKEYQRYLQLSPTGRPGAHEIQIHKSLTTALVEMSRIRPHCLVVEMRGSLSEQQDTLKALTTIGEGYFPVMIYFFSKEIGLNLPALPSHVCSHIHSLQSELTADWIHGFVTGLVEVGST